ncbi:AbrB family transcriptional regulator, partial [Synechococcus lacustris]
GNLLIGKAYTAMLDLKPGDDFDIKLGRKQIRLIPVGGSEEED